MSRKAFRWADPVTGEKITAEMTTESEHVARAARRYADGKRVNTFTDIMEITQPGFDCVRRIVVFRCDQDGKTWAFKTTTFWPIETSEYGG